MEPPEGVNGRLARFVASRNASDLWPDIPAAAFRAAHQEIARVTGGVLAGARGPARLDVPGGVDPRVVGVAAFTGGTGPLLGYWCETGAVRADAPLRRILATHLEHGRRRAAKSERELARILSELSAGGIEPALLRGTHTRYRYFPEPATRSASDIHLLVRPEDWEGAREGLRKLDFVQSGEDTEGDRTLWAPAGEHAVQSLEFAHEGDPWTVELRRSLRAGPCNDLAAAIDAAGATTREQWPRLPCSVRTLAQPLLLAYLAVHASSRFYGMMQAMLAELVLVMQRDFGGRADAWEAFERLVDRTSLYPRVFPALDLAERLVPNTLPAKVHERMTAGVPSRLFSRVRQYGPGSILEMHPMPEAGKSVWASPPG